MSLYRPHYRPLLYLAVGVLAVVLPISPVPSLLNHAISHLTIGIRHLTVIIRRLTIAIDDLTVALEDNSPPPS